MGRSVQWQRQLVLGYFVRPICIAQQIPSGLIIGKELLWQLKGELGAQKYYNRRRINTSLVTLSVQLKRTDVCISLFRQGQAVRIGLQSKSECIYAGTGAGFNYLSCVTVARNQASSSGKLAVYSSITMYIYSGHLMYDYLAYSQA